jgi:homoserine kinase
VLAVALEMFVEVMVEPASRLEVVTSGEGAHLPADAEHMAVDIASQVAGHDRLRVSVHSDIPLGRGLGSSAALAVATAAAAGATDPFSWGVRVDGHPENAAASSFGGLVAATIVDGVAVWRRLALDPELVFVAVIPELELLTSDARRVLHPRLDRADAIFNLGRLALLIAGLGDRTQLVAGSGDDRLHQDARAALFPESVPILAGLRRAGALTSFWSGAGTTLIGVCDRLTGAAVRDAGDQLLAAHGVPGQTVVLEAAREGITLRP